LSFHFIKLDLQPDCFCNIGYDHKLIKILFFISDADETQIFQVLFKYCEPTNVKRDQHKKEMQYYDKLMDLKLSHINE
jgi:hypothetical protein